MERSNQEILEKIKKLESDCADFFGFQRGDLIAYLPFDEAKPFLKEGTTAEDWSHTKGRDSESIKSEMLDYMPFAWEKANDNRGISAGRSINHMQVWLWMLREDEASKEIENYSLYGKPQLRAICEHFGWDWKQWDDGRWANDEGSDGSPAPPSVKALPFSKAA